MKITDQQLKRLLAAAARQPSPGERMPDSMQARILARWRSPDLPEDWLALQRFFRVGFGLACVLLLITVAASLWDLNRHRNEELAMPNLIINLAFTK